MTCLQLVCEIPSSWLALWHAPYRAYSLHFMWFHRGDESNKGQACHTPSRIRHSTRPWALQAVSICDGCCQLWLLFGARHLLQRLNGIFLLLWIVIWRRDEYEGKGKERRRQEETFKAVKHSVFLSIALRIPIVFSFYIKPSELK